ncbi:MAG: hypothetical protein ACR2PG_14210 [Hyphomicrobiaceae bacterium]
MKRVICILLALLSGACLQSKAQVVPCVGDRDLMPGIWRPSMQLRKTLSDAEWSDRETNDAEYAFKLAIAEMTSYFEQKPAAVTSLWDDSVEALMQLTYSSLNNPAFDAKVLEAARDNLTTLIEPYLHQDRGSANCDDFERLLPLAIFAQSLFPAQDARMSAVTRRVNSSLQDCGSLEEATGYDLQEILEEDDVDEEDLFDLYVWSLWLIEAQLYPNIRLPSKARDFAPKIWKYFETFDYAGVREFDDGAWSKKFRMIAVLATHVAHIPSGTHRYPIYVADSPRLFRFYRENFYPVMATGDLDLFASFVDSLRQYGCTPKNDVQVRDGTRYLLRLFHENKERWMAHREKGEADATLDDYTLIHKPWTAALGLRSRRLEQPNPGTYGGAVRRWLLPPSRRIVE